MSKIKKAILHLLLSIALCSAYTNGQIIIRDSIAITPREHLRHTALSSAEEGFPTVTYTITLSCAENPGVRMIHQDGCSDTYDLDEGVVANGVYTYTFPAPPATAAIGFFYYGWAIDGDPPVNYTIEATFEHTGETFYAQGSVPPRSGSDPGWGGGYFVTPYKTGFDFLLDDFIYEQNEIHFNYYAYYEPGNMASGDFFGYSLNNCQEPTVWSEAYDPIKITITDGKDFVSFYESTDAMTFIGDSVELLVQEFGTAVLRVDSVTDGPFTLTLKATGGRGVEKERTTTLLPKLLHHFEVWTEPSTIRHGDTAIIFVQTKNRNNDDLPPEYSFVIEASPEDFGHIEGGGGNAIVRTLQDTLRRQRAKRMLKPAKTNSPANSEAIKIQISGAAERGKTQIDDDTPPNADYSYIADWEEPVRDTTITLTVVSSDDETITGTGSLVITVGETLCPVVSIVPSTIKAGETAEVIVKGKKDDGTVVDYPEGTQFTFTITNGAEYGTIVGNTSPAQFKAKEEIDFPEGTDEVNVTISAAVGGGVSASVKGSKNYTVMNAPSCPVPAENIIIQRPLRKCKDNVSVDNVGVEIITRDCAATPGSFASKGGNTGIVPFEGKSFFNPQVCFNTNGFCVGLMIPEVHAQIKSNICVPSSGPRIINSENDIPLNDVDMAKRAITSLTRQIESIKNVIVKFGKVEEPLSDGDAALDPMDDFYSPEGVRIHEEVHIRLLKVELKKALENFSAKSDEFCKKPQMFVGLSEEQIKEKLNWVGYYNRFMEILSSVKKVNYNSDEISTHSEQKKFLEGLRAKIQEKFHLPLNQY